MPLCLALWLFPGVCAGSLEVFTALAQFLTAPSLHALLKAAPTLLLRLSSRRARTALCGALEAASARGEACSLLSPMAVSLRPCGLAGVWLGLVCSA